MQFGKNSEKEESKIKTSENQGEAKEKREKNRYSFNLKHEPDNNKLLNQVLDMANDKDYGEEVTVKHIAIAGAKYLLKTKKEMESIKLSSKTPKERAMENLEKYNLENGTNYNIHEYQCAVMNL